MPPFYFCRRKGLVEGGHAEGGAENMPVTCFLARGRVHGSMTAARRAVGMDPYLLSPYAVTLETMKQQNPPV